MPSNDSAVKTVEDLNPRARDVVALRMTVKRAMLLREIMAEMFTLLDGDITELRTTPPGLLVSATRIKEIWGDDYRTHPEYNSWAWAVEMWHSGSLDSQILSLAANLPKAERKKLGL